MSKIALESPRHKKKDYSSKDAELPINAKTDAFRKEFFPDASAADWNNWQWQIKSRITTFDRLSSLVNISPDEAGAGCNDNGAFSVSITPYYASLLDRNDPLHPIRRMVIPVRNEDVRTDGESEDPLGEEKDSPVPGIIHRYPDRVLFLATGLCSVRCRYCTRSRVVDQSSVSRFSLNWKDALAYIESNASIRDVLLSGGDPLTLPDDALDWLLSRLSRIQHVDFLRIGTKVPAALPQRITKALIRILKKHHPLWMSIHFIHPDELTPEVKTACNRLADAGIPLGSQTVLLRGVNDDAEVMKKLMHGLITLRVKPYYLYQCDPIIGSSHFRTPVHKGLEIIQKLRGHTTGYAVPTFVIDAPGGGGKIPLLPDYVIGREGDSMLLRNYKGMEYRYRDKPE